MRGSRRLPWLVPTLLLAALFAALGQWQLERGRFKAQLLADFEAAIEGPPQPFSRHLQEAHLPLAAESAPAQQDRTQASLPARLAGSGRFDTAATVILDNQVLQGRPGAHVLTLFHPFDSARPLLVNLGWMPLQRDRPQLPELPTGEVWISGLLVPPPSVGIRLAQEGWRAGAPPPLLAHLDVAALREQMDEELFDGQLLLDPDIDFGLLRRWQALPNTLPPERHRGYAVQWFGLALAVLAVYLVLARRRRRPEERT